MKKKNFPVWVCFIAFLGIISSCKSKEKNPVGPGTGDSSVISEKGPQTANWNTNTELILGTIQADLKIDGMQVSVDSGKITIRPKTDFSAIEIYCSRGQLTLKSGWHGMGDYDKAYAEWYDMAQTGPGIRYSSDYDAPGTMKVTEWGDGKVAGSFSVTVIENNTIGDPGKKLLEGEFHYLHDR